MRKYLVRATTNLRGWWKVSVEQWRNNRLISKGKTKKLEEKPAAVPLLAPHISREVARD
jgi:hypothetical protein